MTIITDALVPALNNTNIINSSKKLMVMFDGTMPTKEQFEAVMYTTIRNSTIRGQYNIASMITWATGLGNTVRAHCLYPVTVPAHHMGPTKIRFPLSVQPEEFTKVDPGTVNWFMFLCVATSATTYNSNVAVYWGGIGDVGDVGSNADIILPGSLINAVDALKANDLIFNYSGM